MANLLGGGLSIVAGKLRELASDIVTVRTGTVVSDYAPMSSTMVVLDNDPESSTVQALALWYPYPAGARVNMLAYPPRGLVVTGPMQEGYFPAPAALQAEIDAAEAQIAALQAAIADTGWAAPALSGTWANYGAPFATAGYRKIGSVVYLRGLIRNGVPGTALFTLPVGFRPTFDLLLNGTNANNFSTISGFTDGANITNTSNPVAGSGVVNHVHPHAHQHNTTGLSNTTPDTGLRVNVSTAGVVSHTASGSNAYQSLDGLSFLAN